MRLLNLVLGLVAYRQLLWVTAPRDVGAEVESWFFVPADTSPLVVILISAWLLYRRRERLRNLASPGGPIWLVAGLALTGTAFFFWAIYTGAHDLLVPSLMLNVLAFGVGARGRPILRVLLPPVAVLIFAIPMPAPLLSHVVWQFQLWTAESAGWIFFALGIPVHVSGDLIHRVGQSFEVIETCSGLRSVETLTLLAVLMADLFKRRRLHGLLLIGAAPLVAFIMNGFRVVTLILNPDSETLAVHNTQGVLVLLCGLVLLYFYDGLLVRLLGRFRSAPSAPGPDPVSSSSAAVDGGLRGFAVSAVLAGLVAASFWLPTWPMSWGAPVFAPHEHIPLEMGPWRGAELESRSWFNTGGGFFYTVHRHYRLAGRHSRNPEPVELFVGLGVHKMRSRSPFSPKNAYPGAGWGVEDEGVTVLEPGAVEVAWRVLRNGPRLLLVYQWQQGGRGLGIETLRSFFALDTSPFRRERRALVYRMSTELRGRSEGERERAGKHLQRLYREIHPRLRPPLGDSS